MSGHLTLSKSRHISTLNYLRSADTCLTRMRTVIYWLSVPAITDSANKCHVFGGHFNPKSLTARTLTCDRQFFQMSMLHVCYVKPAMLKKRTILSFDQCASCRALAFELVRQNANSTYRSQQSGHNFKEQSWPSGIRAAGLI